MKWTWGMLVFVASGSVWASPAPSSMFGAPNGITPNAAQTKDVGTLDEVVEYDRLVDAAGITACDRYFGWNGQQPDPSAELELLCGKYQFFYEHFATAGLPTAIFEFNDRWYRPSMGEELVNFGYQPDPRPRRRVTDVEVTPARTCLQTQTVCASYWWWGTCRQWTTQCVEQAQTDLYRETYTMGEDHLPIGFVNSPKRVLGVESSSFTCAGCHLARLPDGRFAVGMGNHRLAYGSLLVHQFSPIQATLLAVDTLIDNPVLRAAGDVLLWAVPSLQQSAGLLDILSLHPEVAFAHRATDFAFFGPAHEAALADAKLGRCYAKDANFDEIIACHRSHPTFGDADQAVQAAAFEAELAAAFGPVFSRDWPWSVDLTFGATYCLPWPFTPAQLGGSNAVQWGQYVPGLFGWTTLQRMAQACDGNRWNSDFWFGFTDSLLMVAMNLMVDADNALEFTPTFMDGMLRLRHGTMDFVSTPLTEDDVWTVSKIPSLFNVPSQADLAAHPQMRNAGGDPTVLLSHTGSVASLESFVEGFILISQSVDPRYVECTTPGIVGNWDADPDGSCAIKSDTVRPLARYIASLRAPYPLDIPPAPAPGRALFDQHCADCHSGPQGQSEGSFVFGPVGSAGLSAVPECGPGELSVEWTDDRPAQPIHNGCAPTYAAELLPNYLGVIDTDATYSRIFNPDPELGLLADELQSIVAAPSQGVRAMRLAGVRYRSNLLHHGWVRSLDELLCMPDTARETAAQRSRTECLRYDLSTPAAQEQLQAGQGVCTVEFRPYQGHTFGCELSESDRNALIDYLRTL